MSFVLCIVILLFSLSLLKTNTTVYKHQSNEQYQAKCMTTAWKLIPHCKSTTVMWYAWKCNERYIYFV